MFLNYYLYPIWYETSELTTAQATDPTMASSYNSASLLIYSVIIFGSSLIGAAFTWERAEDYRNSFVIVCALSLIVLLLQFIW